MLTCSAERQKKKNTSMLKKPTAITQPGADGVSVTIRFLKVI